MVQRLQSVFAMSVMGDDDTGSESDGGQGDDEFEACASQGGGFVETCCVGQLRCDGHTGVAQRGVVKKASSFAAGCHRSAGLCLQNAFFLMLTHVLPAAGLEDNT